MTAPGLKLIAPIDAFRLILRDHYPSNPALPDQITEMFWFISSQGRPKADAAAAWRALDTIKGLVAAGNIRVHGIETPNSQRVQIDPVDLARGELDIWKQEIDCSKDGVRAFIYKDIFFIDEDVRRLVDPQKATTAAGVKPNRTSPEQDRAKKALNALFSDGHIPPQEDLPNKLLCTRVNNWLKQHNMIEVKPDAILRAAGRRSK
jgi:hypothetical protein